MNTPFWVGAMVTITLGLLMILLLRDDHVPGTAPRRKLRACRELLQWLPGFVPCEQVLRIELHTDEVLLIGAAGKEGREEDVSGILFPCGRTDPERPTDVRPG